MSAAPILHGVDLVLRPGELTAVMGASGAGKSTLLELAAGRREAGTTTGRVMYNGVPLSAALRHCIAFVHQHDVALATLTVRETLRYAAALRMPHAAADRGEAVERMLSLLRLGACADTRVERVSGGERKRLSIGVELVRSSPVLLLDEPTTGLDAPGAHAVAASLQRLARAGHTVAMTIHQPSPESAALFDRLVLLWEGRVAYDGPAADATAFLRRALGRDADAVLREPGTPGAAPAPAGAPAPRWNCLLYTSPSPRD